MYLLDTDTVSYIIKKRPDSVYRKLSTTDASKVAVSAISYSELLYGAEASARPEYYRALIWDFIHRIRLLDWPVTAADHLAVIRAQLDKKGLPIGMLDTQIAAHALALNAILVTNNTRHFSRVSGLQTENWVK